MRRCAADASTNTSSRLTGSNASGCKSCVMPSRLRRNMRSRACSAANAAAASAPPQPGGGGGIARSSVLTETAPCGERATADKTASYCALVHSPSVGVRAPATTLPAESSILSQAAPERSGAVRQLLACAALQRTYPVPSFERAPRRTPRAAGRLDCLRTPAPQFELICVTPASAADAKCVCVPDRRAPSACRASTPVRQLRAPAAVRTR